MDQLVLTTDMKIVLGLVGLTMLLFLFQRVRADLVALVVLVMLGLTGLVQPEDLFNGFSSNAVISVIATMIWAWAGPHRRAQPPGGTSCCGARAASNSGCCCSLGHHPAQLLGDAEPVGDGAVPAGDVAAVLAHRHPLSRMLPVAVAS